MPDAFYAFFLSVGFFFTLGVLLALALAFTLLTAVSKLVDYLWPKPKESKDGTNNYQGK